MCWYFPGVGSNPMDEYIGVFFLIIIFFLFFLFLSFFLVSCSVFLSSDPKIK